MCLMSMETMASILMQDVVGDYDDPQQLPEWQWVEQHSSFAHRDNGEDGVWEFVINLSRSHAAEPPPRLLTVMDSARRRGVSYLLVHQGT